MIVATPETVGIPTHVVSEGLCAASVVARTVVYTVGVLKLSVQKVENADPEFPKLAITVFPAVSAKLTVCVADAVFARRIRNAIYPHRRGTRLAVAIDDSHSLTINRRKLHKRCC